MSDLFSNPTMLIVLALGAVLLLGGGGGSLNLTELILSLLRGLKLIPAPQAPPSEQVYRGYVQRAWSKLRDGDVEQSRALLEAAAQEAEQHLVQEQAIAPAGIMTIFQDWLKSPIFLIAIAVGAFLIFGGGSCKKQDPQPQETASVAANALTLVSHETAQPYTGSHYFDVQRLHMLQASDMSDPSDPCLVTQVGFWTNGPVRRVASAPARVAAAPVRAVAQAQPIRRAAKAVAQIRPLQRVASAVAKIRPLQRVGAALFGRRR